MAIQAQVRWKNVGQLKRYQYIAKQASRPPLKNKYQNFDPEFKLDCTLRVLIYKSNWERADYQSAGQRYVGLMIVFASLFIICLTGDSYRMKYECVNCSTCCIYASPEVTYCALSSECTQTLISNGQAITFALIIVFLLGAALTCLYFAFRNRKLDPPEQSPNLSDKQTPQKREILASEKSKKEEEVKQQRVKANQQLRTQTKMSSRSMFRPTWQKTNNKKKNKSDTQRGLR